MATAIHEASTPFPTISMLIARHRALNERPAAGDEMGRLSRAMTTTPARTLGEVAMKLHELVDCLDADGPSWALDMARSCLTDMTILQ